MDGVPTLIHDGADARMRSPDEAPLVVSTLSTGTERVAEVTTQATGTITLAPVVDVFLTLPNGQRVVGGFEFGTSRLHLEKTALVLAPYLRQFGAKDSARDAVAALEPLDDYDGRVTFHSTPGVNTVTLADYASWSDFDVVFVSTHGDSGLVAPFSEPYLFLGIGNASTTCAMIDNAIGAAFPDDLNDGLYCAPVNVGSAATPILWRDVAATPSFFRKHYPGGLETRLVYLDACKSAVSPALLEAILGEDAVGLGWDDYVDAGHSQSTAKGFFESAAMLGFPAARSFIRACGPVTGSCQEPTSIPPTRGGRVKRAELLFGYDRADIRVRDGLKVTVGADAGGCFEVPGVPISASCPSCGNPEVGVPVTFSISVDGLEPLDVVAHPDPDDFAKKTFRVAANVDSIEECDAIPFIDGVAIEQGDGRYTADVALSISGVCPGDMIEYDPKILLPSVDVPTNPGAGECRDVEIRDFMFSHQGPYELTFGGLP